MPDIAAAASGIAPRAIETLRRSPAVRSHPRTEPLARLVVVSVRSCVADDRRRRARSLDHVRSSSRRRWRRPLFTCGTRSLQNCRRDRRIFALYWFEGYGGGLSSRLRRDKRSIDLRRRSLSLRHDRRRRSRREQRLDSFSISISPTTPRAPTTIVGRARFHLRRAAWHSQSRRAKRIPAHSYASGAIAKLAGASPRRWRAYIRYTRPRCAGGFDRC